MKKILIALILGFVFMPLTVMAQKWVEPYTDKNGSQVEGHWQTPEENWQNDYSKPGNVNPLTGQFNTYGRKIPGSSANPNLNTSNPYAIPGSSPDRSTPNPYAIPGSSSRPGPYNQRR